MNTSSLKEAECVQRIVISALINLVFTQIMLSFKPGQTLLKVWSFGLALNGKPDLLEKISVHLHLFTYSENKLKKNNMHINF